MSLERADFVGGLWLTTPLLLLFGSQIQRQSRWLLLLPFLAFCLYVAFQIPPGADTAKNYTFGTGNSAKSSLTLCSTNDATV